MKPVSPGETSISQTNDQLVDGKVGDSRVRRPRHKRALIVGGVAIGLVSLFLGLVPVTFISSILPSPDAVSGGYWERVALPTPSKLQIDQPKNVAHKNNHLPFPFLYR